MRFAGTWRRYSKSAMPQLATTANISGTFRKRRCPYQAAVMKTLESVSSTAVFTQSGMRRRPGDLLAKSADRGRVIVGLEDRRAGDEDVRARAGRSGGVVCLDAAVDLDHERCARLLAERACGRELLHRARDERLPAPPRVHAHDEKQVDRVEERADALERR